MSGTVTNAQTMMQALFDKVFGLAHGPIFSEIRNRMARRGIATSASYTEEDYARMIEIDVRDPDETFRDRMLDVAALAVAAILAHDKEKEGG